MKNTIIIVLTFLYYNTQLSASDKNFLLPVRTDNIEQFIIVGSNKNKAATGPCFISKALLFNTVTTISIGAAISICLLSITPPTALEQNKEYIAGCFSIIGAVSLTFIKQKKKTLGKIEEL